MVKKIEHIDNKSAHLTETFDVAIETNDWLISLKQC